MVYEYYYYEGSDYVTCDYMDCGEAECFDLAGELTCMCVDTLTPPTDGLCQPPEIIDEIGSGVDSTEGGVIAFSPGFNIFSQVTQELPTPQQPEDVILSSTVYLISGLCALLLLSVGLFIIFYVSFCKKARTSRNGDIESESVASSRLVSASQSPLLIHSVQPAKICPFSGTNSTLSAVQPSFKTESFGTFDRRSK